MDAILGITTNGYNYPINVYPAGSYGYSVTQQDQDVQSKADPVTVNYPAGLGTSVSANFKNTNTASLTTTMSGTSDSLSFGVDNTNGPLKNGSGVTADQNVIFNNAVKSTGTNGQSSIANDSTITLTENSTRPQSVWYTVSASGNTGGDSNTAITQQLYTPTTDESNNIFAITPEKIPGATNNGAGGRGYGMGNNGNSSLSNPSLIYTTIVGNNSSDNINNNFGIPFASPTTSLKAGTANEGNNTTITLSQNYLPLGITSAVKDAYFNHNGII